MLTLILVQQPQLFEYIYHWQYRTNQNRQYRLTPITYWHYMYKVAADIKYYIT